jgi:hypothetical protein
MIRTAIIPVVASFVLVGRLDREPGQLSSVARPEPAGPAQFEH